MNRKEITITISIISGLLITTALGFGIYSKISNRPAGTTAQSAQATTEEPKPPTSVRLIAVGDFVPHDTINQAAKEGDTYNYLKLMQSLKPFFDKADLRFCSNPVPAAGAGLGYSGYPSFNAPTEFSRDSAALGCNIVNFGSNHSFDKGQAGIDATLNYWDTQSSVKAVSGANRSAEEQSKIRYFESQGLKFALLGYTTYTNSKPPNGFGVNVFSKEFAAKQLAEARPNADVVIVSMRWGTEYSPDIVALQDDISKFLADNGADIVIGHGPHVLQPVKKLTGQNGRETIVWYSVGNFINSQLQVETLFGCLAVMDIDIATKSVTSLGCLPFYMHYEWSAEEKARNDLGKRRNVGMFSLGTASEPLARSQNKTTVEAQLQRITDLLNKFMPVKILSDTEY